jgi:hypothetical protein
LNVLRSIMSIWALKYIEDGRFARRTIPTAAWHIDSAWVDAVPALRISF